MLLNESTPDYLFLIVVYIVLHEVDFVNVVDSLSLMLQLQEERRTSLRLSSIPHRNCLFFLATTRCQHNCDQGCKSFNIKLMIGQQRTLPIKQFVTPYI